MLERQIGRGFLLAALLLAGCAAPPRPMVEPPPARPAAPGAVWEVVASDLAVRAYRDGPLARLGHNHVIASTSLSGRVVLREPLEESFVELQLPVSSLAVDEPARRAAAGDGFEGDVPAADREATLRNLLGPELLVADRYPVIRMQSVSIASRDDRLDVTVRVDIAGSVRLLTVPVQMRREGDRLETRGQFTVTHAELGLKPFSVALGALRVRDGLDVEFRLTAAPDRDGTTR